VSEEALNDAVKNAVRETVLKPDVILAPLRTLDRAEAREKAQQNDIAAEVEKESKQIEIEEQRILDAYRISIISPAQLGQQLEKIRARRTALDLRRVELQQKSSVSPEQVEAEVTDFCAQAAENIGNFTAEQWREFLRVIIQRIVFHGDSVRIQGRIPIGAEELTSGCEIQMEVPLIASG
jgi:hypothetical protein